MADNHMMTLHYAMGVLYVFNNVLYVYGLYREEEKEKSQEEEE